MPNSTQLIVGHSLGAAMPRQHFGRLWAASYLIVSLLLSSSAALPEKADYQSVQESQASSNSAPSTRTLVIKLYSERTGTLLDRQAMSKLTNLADNSAIWQISNDNSEVVFASIYDGSYEIEVSAIGHTPFRRELEVTKSNEAKIEIVLQRDTSLTGSDLDVIVSPKTRKLIKQSLNLLKSEKLTQAQKQLDQAYSLAPNSADVNFLLGYLYFRQKDFARARTYLDNVAKLNPRNAQALTLLGRTHLEREDLPAALSTLQQAILLDFENWVPHNLLATAYFREGNYDKARDEAEIALRNGKRAASPAQLILAESLFEAGHGRQAVEALNVFLEESPQHPMAGQLRNLVAKIDEQLANLPSESTAQPATLFSDIDPLAAVPAPALPTTSWQPPGVDETKPPTAPGVNCPFGQVMERTGKSVEQLVQDVGRFAAVEALLHQNIDNYGIPVRTLTRKYNYVAAISEPATGMLNVDEYRSEMLTLEGYPDRIASTGFAALALVFHPHMSEAFTMACEGLGDWNGQASWLVHFRQRDDRPNTMHNYKVGNQNRPVGLKGRAWIKADTFQIVRIEAEIVHPAPDIQLLSEHQIVDYGPVFFSQKQTTVWLPKTAQIYFDLRKHRYYRRHTFEHYMLYSVDTNEKRKEPTPTPPQTGSDPNSAS